MTETDHTLEGVAVIGMAGRFPDAPCVDEFWTNLRSGKECISFFSDEELLASGVDEALLRDPDYVRAGGILEGIDLFDADFFGFSPREAEITDPQKRLFLECAWEALESASCDPSRFPGRIGVFAGTSGSSYHPYTGQNPGVAAPEIDIANGVDFLATRVSYKLNLRGPSVVVQSACSTSLVALSLAYQALMNYQCDIALAGGVSIYIPQKVGYRFREGGLLSPDGHCRAFDARAGGIVRGSGVGVVVLKRGEDAREDGDSIDAVIKGVAINNDGSAKVGYAAPSVEGQTEVIMEAMELAGVHPEAITYVETHGAGTPLGDAIEIEALSRAFRARTDQRQFCAIGSVKTNIGHTDTVAGIAGLIKTILSLKNREIPPSLNFSEPNPHIDFENSPFFVNTRLRKWDTKQLPRRAGVSSFGLGGTNVHVVLEEGPQQDSPPSSRRDHLLLLSAKTPAALEAASANLAARLSASRPEIGDVAYTLQVGRRAFEHRRVIVCQEIEGAVRALENRSDPRGFIAKAPARRKKVAFLFPGQGAQYPNMALGLYRELPQFQRAVDECCSLLEPLLGCDLREVIYPNTEDLSSAEKRLTQTRYAQPATFTIEYALAMLLRHWEIHPVAVLGHSIGEYAAACLAGIMTLPDAVALLAARGRLTQELPDGAMLAVSMSEEGVRRFLDREISLAAHNAPELCVLSGPSHSITNLESRLAELNINCRRIHVSRAFHSAMMEPIMDDFGQEAAKVRFSTPSIPYFSSMTGRRLRGEQAIGPEYWVDHLRKGVRFSEALSEISTLSDTVLLEVGPGRTLTSLAHMQRSAETPPTVLSSIRHPKEVRSDPELLTETLGRLWMEGVPIDWERTHEGESRRRAPLPTYPFQRRSFWLEHDSSGPSRAAARARADIDDWFYLPSWQPSLAPQELELKATRWLVLAGSEEHCGALIERLEDGGASVVIVRPGLHYSGETLREFELRPGEPNDTETMIQALGGAGWSPTHVLHAWNCSAEDPEPWESESVEERERALGFSSLLALVHSLGRDRIPHPVTLTILTCRAHSVVPGEKVSPGRATVHGLCRVIPQEYPGLRCRCIDLSPAEVRALGEDSFAAQILAEISSGSKDVTVAYRGGARWVPSFSQIHLQAHEETPPVLRSGGVYLITGGLGGIGLLVAGYLAETCKARLILTGRSDFPPEDNWADWVAANGEDDPISLKIKLLCRLKEAGAELLVAKTDVCDRDRMRALIDKAIEQWGAIHGVFHAAGLPSVETIRETSHDYAQEVLRPKVRGTQVLVDVLADRNPDFILLFSSLASVLGGAWLAPYASANAYLNAAATAGSSKSDTRVMVVIWDGWSEVGMGLKVDHPLGAVAGVEASSKSISPQEGIEALKRILRHGLANVAVSTWDLNSRYRIACLETHDRPESGPDGGQPEAQQPGTGPTFKTDSERLLGGIWMEALGVTEIAASDNFFDLGGNSLMIVEVIEKLKKAVDVSIHPDDLMFNTFGQLAGKLEAATSSERTDDPQTEDT